jgi:hypothetical protein
MSIAAAQASWPSLGRRRWFDLENYPRDFTRELLRAQR